MANASSASGSADLSGRYLQLRHGCDLRSIPYFGVRVKSDLWLIIASSTARALLSERPIPNASKHGRKRSSLIHVAGMQLALGTNVKKPDRRRCCEKDRNVDQQLCEPSQPEVHHWKDIKGRKELPAAGKRNSTSNARWLRA